MINLKKVVLLCSMLFCSTHLLAEDSHVITIDSKNILQGISLLSTSEFYTLELSKPINTYQSSIYYYESNKAQKIITDDAIGHQGFSLENKTPSKTVFWTSAKDKSLSAMRFELDKDNKLVKKTEVVLFPNQYNVRNETIPTISADQKYLIVRGRTSSRVMFIRVFNLEVVNKALASGQDKIDISNEYTYSWFMPTAVLINSDQTLRPFQAMASNGSHIYILLGNSKINAKTLFTYTMNGRFVSQNTHVVSGMNLAMKDGGGYFYEPEGISFIPNELTHPYLLFVSGNGNNHFNRVFKVGQ